MQQSPRLYATAIVGPTLATACTSLPLRGRKSPWGGPAGISSALKLLLCHFSKPPLLFPCSRWSLASPGSCVNC